MTYSKAKLKSNGDRASPCFKPFLIGNLSDKFLPTRPLLKLNNYMKITGFINDMFRPQKTKENKNKIIQFCQLCYTVVKNGTLEQQT